MECCCDCSVRNVWSCREYPKSREDREDLVEDCVMKRVEVVVVSYDSYRDNKDLHAILYECVVMDEFHNLKKDTTTIGVEVRKLKTKKRIGLSGTIIQNTFTELWCLLDIIRPGMPSEKKFRHNQLTLIHALIGMFGSKSSFKAKFANPINNGQASKASQHAREKAQQRLKVLRHHMRKFVLRRTKRLLSDSLPEKKVFFAFCKLSPLQEIVYKRILDSPEAQGILAYLEHQEEPCPCGSGKTRKTCDKRCRAATNGLLWPQYHPDGLPCEKCPTCLSLPICVMLESAASHLELVKPETLTDDPEKRSPDEKFRRHVLRGMAEQLNGLKRCSNQAKLGDTQHCGKLKVFTTLLETWRKRRSKVLIFAESTRLLDVIESCFKVENYDFVRLDGKMTNPQRKQAQEEFNRNPQCFAFLISTGAGKLLFNVNVYYTILDTPDANRVYRIKPGCSRYCSQFSAVLEPCSRSAKSRPCLPYRTNQGCKCSYSR